MAAVLEPSTPRWGFFFGLTGGLAGNRAWRPKRRRSCIRSRWRPVCPSVLAPPSLPPSPPPSHCIPIPTSTPSRASVPASFRPARSARGHQGSHPAPMPDFVPSSRPRSVSFLPLPQLMSGKLELLPNSSSAVQSLHPFSLSFFLTFSPCHHQRTYPTPPAFSRLHLDCAPPSRFNTPPTPWRLHLPPLRRALRRRPRPQH